jgi:hypothetical protein
MDRAAGGAQISLQRKKAPKSFDFEALGGACFIGSNSSHHIHQNKKAQSFD